MVEHVVSCKINGFSNGLTVVLISFFLSYTKVTERILEVVLATCISFPPGNGGVTYWLLCFDFSA